MTPGPLTVISHQVGIDPRSPRYELAKAVATSWDRDEDVDRATASRYALWLGQELAAKQAELAAGGP